MATFPRMFEDLSRNVWWHFPECLRAFPSMFDHISWNITFRHSPRSPHSVPRSCIHGFIHSQFSKVKTKHVWIVLLQLQLLSEMAPKKSSTEVRWTKDELELLLNSKRSAVLGETFVNHLSNIFDWRLEKSYTDLMGCNGEHSITFPMLII